MIMVRGCKKCVIILLLPVESIIQCSASSMAPMGIFQAKACDSWLSTPWSKLGYPLLLKYHAVVWPDCTFQIHSFAAKRVSFV